MDRKVKDIEREYKTLRDQGQFTEQSLSLDGPIDSDRPELFGKLE